MMKLIERDKANCSRSAGLWQNLLIYSKQNSTGNNIQTTLRVYSGCHFISTKWMLFKAVILTNCKLTTHTHTFYIYINPQKFIFKIMIEGAKLSNKKRRGTKIKADGEFRTGPHDAVFNYTTTFFLFLIGPPSHQVYGKTVTVSNGLLNANYSVLELLQPAE